MKRIFDVLGALAALIVLSPVLLFVATLIILDSRGPVFFRQERIGRRFRPFYIYKFRTMVENASQLGGMICSGNDPRITRIGRLLRKTKIDEFPQLINVLKGDMSLVGPRPELWPFVELFYGDYQEILDIRPGITDLASLKYRDEAAILGRAEHPDQEYITHVLPDKIRLAKYYVRHSSLVFDLHIILTTLSALFDASDTMINGTIASLAPADVVAGIDCQNSSDRETIIPVLDRFSA